MSAIKSAIVSSVVGGKPMNGGNAWAVLSWTEGLRRLGVRVTFVEQIGSGSGERLEDTAELAYFNRVMNQLGFSGCSALISDDGDWIYGMTRSELLERGAEADLLINITGHLTWEALKGPCRRKVYLDLDPGYTQIWHASGNSGPRLAGHDYYYTVGENVGTSASDIPTSGIPWRPIRQPVMLEQWPVTPIPRLERFTTVASWRGAYGPLQWEGRVLGVKAHEFRKFVELPRRVDRSTFEIALEIYPGDAKDRSLLEEHGWKINDPKVVAGDPQAFRSYVQQSSAEFSVAQGVYVQTGSGWFSDRTVRYLASGKPALVQETGFSRNLPVGDGLLAFTTLDEASAGAARIIENYDGHCRAARALAEEYFDSRVVLSRLLNEVE
jgi:hypothetical protein